MASRAFGTQVAASHLVRGSGGLSGEIYDLRQDVEAAMVAVESQIEQPTAAQAYIRLNTQPTAADTITIGSDVYEFVAALGDEQGTNIGVLRGASAAAARTNIINAINHDATYLDSTHSVQSTENVVASLYNTDYLLIQSATAPGGAVRYAEGDDVALSDGLTAAVSWSQSNLNKTGFSGGFKKAMVRIEVTAGNLAADFDVVLPFTPLKASCFLVTTADTPDAAKASNTTDGLTLVAARNAVTVNFNGPGGTDVEAGDIVYLEVYGL